MGFIDGGNLTPKFDRYAEEALVFRRAFANGPGTNQSFPAILTSTYFLMHGGFHLRYGYPTLAEVMGRNGYQTVAFHSNPFLSRFFGWARGFQEFYDSIEKTRSPSAVVAREGMFIEFLKKVANSFKIADNERFQRFLKRLYYLFSDYEIPYLEAKKLNQRVMEWTRRHKNTRFFLWMHYMDPHPPLIPPAKYLSEFSNRREALAFNMAVDTKKLSGDQTGILKSLYEGEVRYVDESIAELFMFLDEEKILQHSLVVFLADHGHAFMEHNRFGHAYDALYNEVLHVPLMIYGLEQCGIVETSTQLLDVPSTILHVLGLKKPPVFIGKNLIGMDAGNNTTTPIISETARPDLINLRYDLSKKAISCIFNGYKLIENQLKETIELYHIVKDFREKEDLADVEKEVREHLMSIIKDHLKNVGLSRKILELRRSL